MFQELKIMEMSCKWAFFLLPLTSFFYSPAVYKISKFFFFFISLFLSVVVVVVVAAAAALLVFGLVSL